MPGKRSPRGRLARKACDPCRVRKIRCDEVVPCSRCVASGIKCTFKTAQNRRGPKGLRENTVKKIQQKRQSPEVEGSETPEAENISHLLEILDIYASRLYPIWPIVKVAELKDTLLANPVSSSILCLANAVALSTVAQLKLSTAWKGSAAACTSDITGDHDNQLDRLRVSFFLHIYYENLEGGGNKSLLYLREAITLAQIARLERESTYTSLPERDQQLSRRVLWLLFVTERGVALLHRLPAILQPNILLPWYGVADDIADILPEFLKLVNLFWVFDQSGVFEWLRSAESGSRASVSQSCITMLQQTLEDSTKGEYWVGNDIQRADILVTRQWMRAVLWRAALRFGIMIPIDPVRVAQEFLTLIASIPPAALESHGPTVEFKTFEIATAVIDAMANDFSGVSDEQPKRILHGLRNILLSSRGGNEKLLSLLNVRMSAVTATRFLPQPYNVERFVEDVLLSMGEDGNWRSEDFFPQLHLMPLSPNGLSSQCPETTGLTRSPSPLTRLLLEGRGQPGSASSVSRDIDVDRSFS
ncbi:hypothetical protein JDV02_002415 [Purpureocillium takamizusanense]|uniref:Zn(2)-C6 fungal-type domain-containing protein n=1 Tax=Purpureocillium takamizusanense TaxID=2060973 RepID=A0A9Q8QBJ4_9HYPO|nr:uncharacterized protein JDV02_002415 [Purpureocillium takamizusanense]UNI15931.1 hypothetical protein JDV02_002415 [Purpureocillium takamizusanense]